MIEGKWLKDEEKEKKKKDHEKSRTRTRLVTYDEEREWVEREKLYRLEKNT